jgi:hypothetical protein
MLAVTAATRLGGAVGAERLGRRRGRGPGTAAARESELTNTAAAALG